MTKTVAKWTILGKIALIYSVVEIYLGLRPRIITKFSLVEMIKSLLIWLRMLKNSLRF